MSEEILFTAIQLVHSESKRKFLFGKFKKGVFYQGLGRLKGVRIDFLDVTEVLEDPCTVCSNSDFLMYTIQNYVAVTLPKPLNGSL